MSSETSEQDIDAKGDAPVKEEFKMPGPVTQNENEEAKAKARYPNLKAGSGPALLQKRLQRGKYFDSGDYNMAQAKLNNPKKPLPASQKLLIKESIGDAIPTPDTLPSRKPSLIQSKLAAGAFS